MRQPGFIEIKCVKFILFLLYFLADNFYVDDFARFTVLDSKDKTAAVANSMTYLSKKGIVKGDFPPSFLCTALYACE